MIVKALTSRGAARRPALAGVDDAALRRAVRPGPCSHVADCTRFGGRGYAAMVAEVLAVFQ